MISFDKLWLLMRKNKMNKTQLRVNANISTSTFAKLTHNEMVSLDVMIRLCEVFNCQLSDICTIDFKEKV